jgi:hypothetical protein
MSDINVPTTETGKRMLASVSPIYDRSYVARWLFEVMGIEMEEARQYIEELRLQAHPKTATWGLFYWEMRYHIPIDESLPIEDRRQKVMSKRWKYAPMNPARMEEYINRASGRTAIVTEYNDEYRIEITISRDEGVLEYDKIVELVRTAKPSHIAIQIILEANCGINVHAQPEAYPFRSRATGTYPYRNVEGRPINIDIAFAPELEAHIFRSVPSGKTSAGTIPQRNTEGRVAAAEITSTVAAVGYTFESRLCGMPIRRL